MSHYTIKTLEVVPAFDLELLMNACQETRISGSAMDKLASAWDRWLPLVNVTQIEGAEESYLLVWLQQAVEDEVDDMWKQSPSEAYLFNALAQVMCMGIVHSLLPQVEEIGCAPAPRPTDMLADALEAAGAPYLILGETGLARRYAVVTHYPFKGGCEICILQENCPKSGKGASVTLPGYE